MSYETVYKLIMIVFFGILNLFKYQIFSTMKAPENKEKAIDEIVKIIQDFQYNDELSEKYKREILDQDKIYE